MSEKCGAICCGCPRSCWCAWGSVSFPGSGAPGTCLWWISWSMPWPGEGLFWLLMAAAVVGVELLDAFRMRRLLRSLGTGVPLERPRSWRLQKRVTQAVMVLIWVAS